MELASVSEFLAAFYRLVGSVSDDGALVEQGEGVDDVGYLYLTRGSRSAQRWMLKMGYDGWSQRTAALTFLGADATDGGRYVALPTDFLRARGNRRDSALREANGDRWGTEIDPEQDHLRGDFYYIKGSNLWVARTARTPTTVYLDYHYMHPGWDAALDDADIEFPEDARALVVAEAANEARNENWLPGGPEMIGKIRDARDAAREKVRDVARQTKSPRQFRKPIRHGNHW